MDDTKIIGEIATLKAEVKALSENSKRHEELIESIRDVVGELQLMRQTLNTTTEKIDIVAEKVTEIENKPAKRWDTVVVGIISAVISCVVGYMLSGIF